MMQDFRCIFCQKECIPIKEYYKNFSDGDFYVMVCCKKHGFILFEKKLRGGLFNPESYWEGRKAKADDFECKSCIHWNINKFSKEDDDSLQKACDLNVPLKDNPGYESEFDFRMGQTIACEKFVHKEINKKRKKR
jgi:hypothetical protein